MRKLVIFLFVFALVGFSACNGNFEKEVLPIEEFVDTFIKNRPNLFNNNVTKSQGDSAFQKEINKLIYDTTGNLFSGVPLELITINQTKNGKYVAQFRSSNTDIIYKEPLHSVMFDEVMVVPDSLVSKLEEGQDYRIEGCIIGRLNGIEVMEALLGKETTAMTNDLQLEGDEYSVEVSLGLYLFSAKSIKPYDGRKMIEKKQN